MKSCPLDSLFVTTLLLLRSSSASSFIDINSNFTSSSEINSLNGECSLKILQQDLVIISNNDDSQLWNAQVNTADKLKISDTGNLELFDESDTSIWTAPLNEETCLGNKLELDDECSLDFKCDDGTSRWSVGPDMVSTTEQETTTQDNESTQRDEVTDEPAATTEADEAVTTEADEAVTTEADDEAVTTEADDEAVTTEADDEAVTTKADDEAVTTEAATEAATEEDTEEVTEESEESIPVSTEAEDNDDIDEDNNGSDIDEMPPREDTELPNVNNPANAQTPLPECFYASDLDVNVSKVINTRCLKEFSSKTFKIAGKKFISYDNQICGVLNSTDVEYSELCFRSGGTNKIMKSIIHLLTLKREYYTSDYKFVSKPKFKALKTSIETKYNKLCIEDDTIRGLGFERAIVTELLEDTSGGNRRKRNTDDDQNKVVAKLIVQFKSASVTNDTFNDAFNDALGSDDDLDGIDIEPTGKHFEQVGQCPEINSIFNSLTPDIIDVINAVQNNETRVNYGETFSLYCPDNKKLSNDDDGFDDDDDVYQLLCNSQGKYDVPSGGAWPTCVNYCSKILPATFNNMVIPPPHSGLEPIDGTNTVAVGKFGKYRCINGVFGVDKGDSDIYEVECINDDDDDNAGKYDFKDRDYYWPICETKTTTISPIIPIAVSTMLDRYTWSINYRHKVYRNTEGDEDFVIVEPEDYIKTVTIPAVIILVVCILLCLCCTRNDSPFCSICNDTGAAKERILIPVKD